MYRLLVPYLLLAHCFVGVISRDGQVHCSSWSLAADVQRSERCMRKKLQDDEELQDRTLKDFLSVGLEVILGLASCRLGRIDNERLRLYRYEKEADFGHPWFCHRAEGARVGKIWLRGGRGSQSQSNRPLYKSIPLRVLGWFSYLRAIDGFLLPYYLSETCILKGKAEI